jgi:hypothetical protein
MQDGASLGATGVARIGSPVLKCHRRRRFHSELRQLRKPMSMANTATTIRTIEIVANT